jgi:hypothetical protein
MGRFRSAIFFREQRWCLRTERYEIKMGSDLVRDGMFLELSDVATGEVAIEVFFSDVDGSYVTTRYRNDVPLDVAAWLQEEARRRLPPIPDAESYVPTGMTEQQPNGAADLCCGI